MMFLGEDGPNFFVLGEAVGFEFGENLGFVQEDLKAAVGKGLQLQIGHAVLELFQNSLRQTDGMRLVPSASAVLDSNLHGFRRIAGIHRGSDGRGGWASPATPPAYSCTLTTSSSSNVTKITFIGGVP